MLLYMDIIHGNSLQSITIEMNWQELHINIYYICIPNKTFQEVAKGGASSDSLQ